MPNLTRMKKPLVIPERTPDGPGGGPHPLAAAKDRARQRIDHDRQRYPESLGPVLAAIAANLFTPGWKAEAAVEPAAWRRFRVALGITPGAYRDRQVLETALELVRESTLPILEIAAGLGFDDPELFTKWFKWRTGEAPTTMRSGDEPDTGPPAGQTTDWQDRDWRKAAAWDESPQRGAAMIRKIRELYPALDHHPPSD